MSGKGECHGRHQRVRTTIPRLIDEQIAKGEKRLKLLQTFRDAISELHAENLPVIMSLYEGNTGFRCSCTEQDTSDFARVRVGPMSLDVTGGGTRRGFISDSHALAEFLREAWVSKCKSLVE